MGGDRVDVSRLFGLRDDVPMKGEIEAILADNSTDKLHDCASDKKIKD